MDAVLASLAMIVLSYLIGSTPPAYIIGKVFHGVDIREQGSGNVGGANAGRLFGKTALFVVGLIDILKGTLAVILTKFIVDRNAAETGFFARTDNIIAIAGFFVVLGHCYSVYLKFSGGKGGATTFGIILAINPFIALILVSFWIIILISTRFTSLANLLVISITPIAFSWREPSSAYSVMSFFLIGLLYIRHKQNIGRLLSGVERKFGQKEEINEN